MSDSPAWRALINWSSHCREGQSLKEEITRESRFNGKAMTETHGRGGGEDVVEFCGPKMSFVFAERGRVTYAPQQQ